MIKTRAKVLNQLKTVKSFVCTCGFVLSFLSTLFVFTSLSFADPNISPSANSANCKNSTLETYSGTSNLSANWGANTINLHWYADSEATTELSGSGIPTSCVYDGALTPPPVASIPQKTGYTFAGWKVRGLPEGYTKLQYIESTGTQWIDTGFTPNQNTKWTINVSASSLSTNFASFGSAGNMFGIYGGSKTYTMASLYNGEYKYFSPAQYFAKGIIYKLTLDRNVFTASFNNNTYTNTYTPATFTASGTLKIFTLDAFSSVRYGKFRMHSSKLYDNGTLVQNLIPAKNSNNVVGMYDLVTKTFFTNAGTGSFTAGPVAQ